MRHVFDLIATQSEIFRQHPLHVFVTDSRIEPRVRLSFLPCAAHFIMSFRDMCTLVLYEAPTVDPWQKIVNVLALEESGHWRWFLADMDTLDCNPTVRLAGALDLIWSEATQQTRLLTYRLCGLGLRANPLRKLVLMQCMERTFKVGGEYAGRAAADFASRHGAQLKYFGVQHAAAEQAHTHSSDDVQQMLKTVELSAPERDGLCDVVRECFAAFTAWLDELHRFALCEQRKRAAAS